MSIQLFTFYNEDHIMDSLIKQIGEMAKKEDPKFAEQTMELLKAKQYIKVIDAILKYDDKVFALSQESDIENIYATLFTFISFIAESESARAITSICQSITKFKGHPETHFTLLNLLYHIIPVSYPESGIILDYLLKYVIETNHYHICDEIISLLLSTNYNLLSCEVELKRQILLSGEKIASHSGKHSDAITLMTYYLETFQNSKSTELDSIKENTIRFVTTIFHYPKFQKLPSYMKLDAIKYLKQDNNNSVLYQLFELFITSNYNELSKFYEEHKQDLEKYKLPYSSIIEHCRLLTLCSLASESDILSYNQIAIGLDIPIDEVENWVVHCINQKLIEGKMNQVKNEVVILRSCTRAFDKQKWNKLEEKLNDFSDKIDGLLQVLEDTPAYE